MPLQLKGCLSQTCDGLSYEDATGTLLPIAARMSPGLRLANPITVSEADAKRFWAKVDKMGPVPHARPDLGKCWVWTAGCFAGGYGQFSIDGLPKKAHRVSYTLVRGEIPRRMPLDHLCKNKSCCNPDHLEPVTYRENAIRCDNEIAQNSRKTHCKNGHEMSGDNLFTYKPTSLRPHGRRYCRVCRRESEARLKNSPVSIARNARKAQKKLKNASDITRVP